jgi:ribosomal protein S7
MHNVEWKIDGDKLILTMDISKQSIEEATPSASGKTYLVASTGSAVSVPTKHARSLTFAINLMAKK